MHRMLFMHGMHGGMAGGFLGFFLFRMVRRLMSTVLILGLIGLVIFLWLRGQRRRQQDRFTGWD